MEKKADDTSLSTQVAFVMNAELNLYDRGMW